MFAFISHVVDPAGKIVALWCSQMHGSPLWPIHGHYQCRVCGRRYRVSWAEPASVRPTPMRAAHCWKLLCRSFHRPWRIANRGSWFARH